MSPRRSRSQTARARSDATLASASTRAPAVLAFLRQPRQRVDESEDREGALLTSDLDCIAAQIARNTVSGKLLGDRLTIRSETLLHRLRQHANEAVATFVPPLDKRLDDPPDLGKAVIDIGRVPSREFDNSTASQTMWLRQTDWNQNVCTPSVRRPTSEFQTKKPGAKASPLISAQPVGSIRKAKRSCSPQ